MKRILAYMDYDAPTGFAHVSENIISRLIPFFESNDIKVDILAYQMTGQEREISKNVSLRHARSFAKNMDDAFYRDGFLKRLTMKPYDLVWIMNDYPMIAPSVPIMHEFRKMIVERKVPHYPKPFKSLLYFPIDSPIPYAHLNNLTFFDQAVTYTEYGKNAIIDQIDFSEFVDHEKNHALAKMMNTSGIEVIPHGIDTVNFRPLPKEGKSELRKKYGIPHDAYVFGSVNKNQPRKDVAGTLVAFRHFLDLWTEQDRLITEDPSPVLYLHTHPNDPSGVNLQMACWACGLQPGHNVFFPLMEKYESAQFSENDMNELYNCFDCFVTTSTAEGWGLTLTQALSVGLPVIYGNHTSQKEIMNGMGYPVKDMWKHFQPGDEQHGSRNLLNKTEVAKHMYAQFLKFIHDEPVDLNYDAILDAYQWDIIADKWKNLILKMI